MCINIREHTKCTLTIRKVVISTFQHKVYSKQLLTGLLVDSADYHPEKELFPEGNARGK